jgi:mannose-6-phosphate isomerase-like protein (cupin superfamily)
MAAASWLPCRRPGIDVTRFAYVGGMTTAGDPCPVSIGDAVAGLTFLADRAPTTTRESASAFAQLAPYRDGGIFVGHWAGISEWERHTVGDEIVLVLDGDTTIFFATEHGERSAELGAGELVVVPRGTWHRFETAVSVKLLSVTPQPTDHRVDPPG